MRALARRARARRPGRAPSPCRRSLSRFALIDAARVAVGLDEDARAGAAARAPRARARPSPRRGRARRVVDRPDQVERVLADAVRGRPRLSPLRRVDPAPPMLARDDPHDVPSRGVRRLPACEQAVGLVLPRAVLVAKLAGQLAGALDQIAVGAQAREPQVAPARTARVPSSWPSPRSSRSRSASSKPSVVSTSACSRACADVGQLLLRPRDQQAVALLGRRGRPGRGAGGAGRARTGRPPGRS